MSPPASCLRVTSSNARPGGTSEAQTSRAPSPVKYGLAVCVYTSCKGHRSLSGKRADPPWGDKSSRSAAMTHGRRSILTLLLVGVFVAGSTIASLLLRPGGMTAGQGLPVSGKSFLVI